MRISEHRSDFDLPKDNTHIFCVQLFFTHLDNTLCVVNWNSDRTDFETV